MYHKIQAVIDRLVCDDARVTGKVTNDSKVFALYRAILSQCSAAPFNDADKDALKHIARNRFQANRHLRSPRRLKLSFYAGYKALDYLDEAVAGEVVSVERIAGYLSSVPRHLRQAPKAPLPPPTKRHDSPYVTPPEHRFLNVFPRQVVEGERKVPYFVRANGFPMVRWKKPQPTKLTRTLKGLIKGKQKNIDFQMDYDEYYIPMADNEDTWEHLTRRQTTEQCDDMNSSWSKDALAGLRVIKEISQERHRKTMEKAYKMVAIVEEEQKLANKERRP